MKYIYPKLPARKTTPFFRISGNGLANCLFVYAKAIVSAEKYNAKIISPAWLSFSLGPYLRKESDKRHYNGIFNANGEINGLKKLWIMLFTKKTNNKQEFNTSKNKILIEEGIYDFFEPLLSYHQLIKQHILSHINPKCLVNVENFNYINTIAVHIRLGDFPQHRRVPMDWYINQIKVYGATKRVLLFSDGKDDELTPILNLPNVQRAFFGGAIQDIIAISKCEYLIGSDSSFSAWGAFLGQVPSSFYRLQFGLVLTDSTKQIIEYKS